MFPCSSPPLRPASQREGEEKSDPVTDFSRFRPNPKLAPPKGKKSKSVVKKGTLTDDASAAAAEMAVEQGVLTEMAVVRVAKRMRRINKLALTNLVYAEVRR